MSEATSKSPTEDLSLDSDWGGIYIDGEWRAAEHLDRLDDENPTTREPFAQIPIGTEAEVDEAFEAATAAQQEWANTGPDERAKVVHKVADLLEEHYDEIAELLAVEGGSAPSKVTIELGGAITFVQDAAQHAFRMDGRHNQSKIPGKENLIYRQPVGTVGVISPWNVPLKLSIRAVAPAIATGNTVVLKPSSETPITGGLLIAKLFDMAGLPDGVLNVVPGPGKTVGDRLSSHNDCDVLAFTGSTGAGRIVGKNTIEHFGLPALELGGNNPHVVLEDADVDRAVRAGTFGSFWNQGQVCISINRHLVHESIYDEYVEKLAERASNLKVGDPREEDTVVGPIINEEQRDQIVGFIEDTLDEGGELEAGGDHDGLFVEPTVISNVTNDMSAACNEHFGPVAPVIPFSTDEEAVELANDTEYGLAGSVHSVDQGRARDVGDRIEVGMMHINDQPVNAEPHTPFGGMKDSGVGRYNGDWIIEEFTVDKWTSIQREDRQYLF